MMHLLETSEEKNHRTIRILVIEDDSDYRELIAENLQTEFPGTIVDCATGFRDATERIKSGKYDHIYIDYSLRTGWGHGPTGLEMISDIIKHSSHSVITAISDQSELNRLMVAAGAARSCPKDNLMRCREVLVA